jgi:hypothetical protein
MRPPPRPTMATDVEIERALRALSAILNERGVRRAEPERLDQLAAEAMGGRLSVRVQLSGGGSGAWLVDERGERLGAVTLREGRWHAERSGAPRSDLVRRRARWRRLLSRLRGG